jgi:hypothetical protein
MSFAGRKDGAALFAGERRAAAPRPRSSYAAREAAGEDPGVPRGEVQVAVRTGRGVGGWGQSSAGASRLGEVLAGNEGNGMNHGAHIPNGPSTPSPSFEPDALSPLDLSINQLPPPAHFQVLISLTINPFGSSTQDEPYATEKHVYTVSRFCFISSRRIKNGPFQVVALNPEH